jgi:hypothetical protein
MRTGALRDAEADMDDTTSRVVNAAVRGAFGGLFLVAVFGAIALVKALIKKRPR